jgi:Mg/Co/Ni transporter MgtE
MAKAHLNSLARFEVYRSLCGLNRSFYLIVQRLQELESKNIFEPAKLTELAALAEELQSEVNHNLLQALERIELEDCYVFGKVRAAREDLRNL